MPLVIVGVLIAALAVCRTFDGLWPDREARPPSDRDVPEVKGRWRSPPAG